MKSAIVLAVLSVVGLAAATTFPDRARLIWKAPPAFPATRRDCAFLPQRPLMAPPHPAWIDDVCARTSCPSAPGQCWEDSTCSSYSGEAVCEPFRPKAFGVPCNDGDKSTHNDVCGGDGKCHGVALECPADRVVKPARALRRGDTVTVAWTDAEVDYHGADFALSYSHPNGGEFGVGVTVVTVTVEGLGDAAGVTSECSFEVKVLESSNPCAGVRCHIENVCQSNPRCEVQDGRAVCVTDAVNDGTYNANKLYRKAGMTIPEATVVDHFNKEKFGVPSRLKCYQGASTCEGRAAFLPKAFLMAPPLPPMPALPEHPEDYPVAAPFVARTTARPAASTTPVPATTRRGRRDLFQAMQNANKVASAPAAAQSPGRRLLSVAEAEASAPQAAAGLMSQSNIFAVLVVGVVCVALVVAKATGSKKDVLPK